LSCLFFYLFLIDFFSILLFNISLIRNRISYLILICFRYGYSSLMIRVTDLRSWPGSIQYIFISMFFLKKPVILNYFSLSNYVFNSFSGFFRICQVDWDISGHLLYNLNFFLLKYNLVIYKYFFILNILIYPQHNPNNNIVCIYIYMAWAPSISLCIYLVYFFDTSLKNN
jgi:hypothetical protein